jgi:hypothetical protein
MSFDSEIYLCKIYTYSDEDFMAIKSNLPLQHIEVILNSEVQLDKTPSIIVGWKNVKNYFPNQRLSNKTINSNISWTYSIEEDKDKLIEDIKFFVNNSVISFINNVGEYYSYDNLLDGDINVFIKKHYNENDLFNLYFNKKCLYIYSGSKTLGINLESLKYIGIDVKEFVINFINNHNCIIFSFENTLPYIHLSKLNKKLLTFENYVFSKSGQNISVDDLLINIGGYSANRLIPYLANKIYSSELTNDEDRFCQRLYMRDIITSWLSSRTVCFNKFIKFDKINFELKNGRKLAKFKYSNKRTITGRINCIDKQFNPQNITKEGEERKSIVSRFVGGKIVVFDYVAFETKLSLYLSGDKEFIQKYQNADLHTETAKVIFEKSNVIPFERKIGKDINHAVLYGGGDDILKKILPDYVIDKNKAIENVKSFLSPIFERSDNIKELYKEFGYITTGLGSIIRPKKEYAAFNNYIQATASEIMVDKLFDIKNFLSNRHSEFLFQVHDSFVFDMHPDDLKSINEIAELLSNYKTVRFDVDCKTGENYKECLQ